MGITSKVCSLFSKNARENADIERRLQSSKELAESFYRDPLIAQYQEYQISDMFSSLEIDAARGIENVPNTGVLTVEQLKVQKRLQNEFLKNMRKLPKAGLSEIYLKSEVFKINPTMKKAFQTILSSNDTANGRNLVGDATIQRVVQRLKMASNEYEVGSVAQKVKGQLGLSGRNKLLRLNNMYTKIARGDKEFEGQTGPTAAESFYLKGNESGKVSEKVFIDGQNVFSESLDFLTKKGELKALRDFSILSIADNNTYQKLLKDKNIDANVKEASKDFRTLGKQRDADVLKGIKRLSGLIKNSKDIALTSSMKYNKVINALEGFSKNVEARMQSKDSGTLPILTLEILPQIEASFYKAFSGEASKVDDAMNGFLALDDILEKNLYTSKVIKNDLNVKTEMDYNIFPLLESYNKNSVKFLHSIENATAYMGAINELSIIKAKRKYNPEFKKDYDAFDSSVDMLNGYMGRLFQREASLSDNPLADKITRIATNFQFMSKLGFNVKTAAKNMTQRTFNYIYFGNMAMSDLREVKTLRPNLQNRIIKGREKSGVFKVNLAESYGDMQMPIEKGADGNYRNSTGDAFIDRVDSQINSVAKKSGFLMQKVENEFNRNSTYDYAYTKDWVSQENIIGLDNLRIKFEMGLRKENGKRYTKKEINEMKNNQQYDDLLSKKSTEFEIRFDKYRQKRAQNFADRIVKYLHYDYSTTQKSFAQTSRRGALVLQFKHYIFSNFVMQKDIVFQGLGDVRSGQLNSEAVGRMTRLGGMYLLVELISSLQSVEFGNLFENAAFEEMKKFFDLFTAENEEEAAEMFFGKGPFAGNLGPSFSTVLDFMTLIGANKIIEKNDTLNFMLGMKGAAERDRDMSKFEQITQMINTQAHRTLFKTGPDLLKGEGLAKNAETVIKGTTGLYNRKTEDRNETILDFKKSLKNNPGNTGSPLQHIDYGSKVLESLDYLDKDSSTV